MTPTTEAETLVACLTPPGTAAIATIGVHGPAAWSEARDLFRPAKNPEVALPEDAEPPRFWFGRILGEVANEVVLALKRRVPVSSVEIHCHGGRQVVVALLETFRARGLGECSWQEWERRTAADPLQAEAAIALAHARTMRTAAILLDQQQGALGQALTTVLANLEAGDTPGAGNRLAELSRYLRLGLHLTQPWRVVIAGAPNVGKSSLVNALAGYQRSIVSPIPGTTRDLVTTLIAIDGWPIEMIDTAGLHEADHLLEQQGMAQARNSIADADLCLWVVDATAPPTWPTQASENMTFVLNKIDLPPAWTPEESQDLLRVSARTGEGLETLCETISTTLVPDVPPARAAVPCTRSLISAIDQARQAFAAGRAEEARHLLQHLIQ